HGHVDPATKHGAAIYYLPSCPLDAEPVEIFHPGKPLDWEALPPMPKPRDLRKAPKRDTPDTESDRRRALALLQRWQGDLASMAEGGRHNRLLELSRSAGGLVGSGLLSRGEVEDDFYGACQSNGL